MANKEDIRRAAHQQNIIDRDDLIAARQQIGHELRDLNNKLAPYEVRWAAITDQLMTSAWPKRLKPEEQPVRFEAGSKGGMIPKPVWPKEPPPFHIDRELRKTLFAERDDLVARFRPEVVARDQLRERYGRLSSQIEKLDKEIERFRQ